MFYQHNMGVGAWIFMVLANIAIWGLIAAFVVWLVGDLRDRQRRRPADVERGDPSAFEILDRRLAAGELSIEEYRRLRDELRGGGQGAGTPG